LHGRLLVADGKSVIVYAAPSFAVPLAAMGLLYLAYGPMLWLSERLDAWLLKVRWPVIAAFGVGLIILAVVEQSA
jgi:hypothetical protein